MPAGTADNHPDADTLWQTIRHIRVAILATQEEGGVKARPMTTVQKSYEGVLWFFVDVEGHPAEAVRAHPAVAVSYGDSADGLYVTIRGDATVVRDRASINALITPEVREWFPEGEGDARIALIAVKVNEAILFQSEGDQPKL
ncbi:hypothetical protein IGB42_02285 [Andreprevotia sp. IGB-42]|uniref:pyridoxamine 5'-phosphate oxidase family protein n=1 Tax=Andreprevotia sp. IGB-42 TaxID=2497473 RepID=UPI0013591B5F|nr:pyridoxamine 5'-phosphate oxidase family protein [Andreprevotia sp. IGB-42]KAF0813356.1 hypothetical protein IGB42_02285 [Andreprevotia sp. IGB-42]